MSDFYNLWSKIFEKIMSVFWTKFTFSLFIMNFFSKRKISIVNHGVKQKIWFLENTNLPKCNIFFLMDMSQTISRLRSFQIFTQGSGKTPKEYLKFHTKMKSHYQNWYNYLLFFIAASALIFQMWSRCLSVKDRIVLLIA